MTSQSFDGEYIARFIQRFGYGAARGSSTRGAVGAIHRNDPIDACRMSDRLHYRRSEGPRYVAKMGAVMFAKKTGQPILPFSISARALGTKGSGMGFRFLCHFHARVDHCAANLRSCRDNDDGRGLVRCNNAIELQAAKLKEGAKKDFVPVRVISWIVSTFFDVAKLSNSYGRSKASSNCTWWTKWCGQDDSCAFPTP